jgi:hypothetical protein
MAKINWTVNITESFVDMPTEHVPVYLEAQRVILNLILDVLRDQNEKLKATAGLSQSAEMKS